MGADVTNSTKEEKVTATPEETELNKLLLERTRATQGGMLDVQNKALNLSNLLLTGQGLPGYLDKLPGGMSEESVKNLVNKSLKDVGEYSNYLGISDSGEAKELGVKTAADIRSQSEQFNLQNLLQLLNLAVGGQAQVQSPILSQTSQLSQNLAGLRTTTSNQSITQMNPFLKSFQTSAGEGMGNLLNVQSYIKPK